MEGLCSGYKEENISKLLFWREGKQLEPTKSMTYGIFATELSVNAIIM